MKRVTLADFPGAPLPEGAYFEDGLIVYGEQAYTPDEWDRLPHPNPGRVPLTSEERRARKAEWNRRARANPEYRARELVLNEQRRRNSRARIVGSLHDGGCTGPTRSTGCVCIKILCYDRPR